MTLFEIADVLWQRGEKEACNALFEHAREYTTLVECGLRLLTEDIVERAHWIDVNRREESYRRAAELMSPDAHEFEAIEERIYEQLCEEGWRAA